MALVTKNDVTQIFAIQAPEVDLPPTFANYPRGWDTARSNNGKPTIKQFNYIQQRTDQNVLWIHQNGAALPYDAAMEYAENAHVVKDGELQKKQGASWVSATNKGYNLDYFVGGKSYPLHAEIMLANGNVVKSTVANNIINPNVDMTGWKKPTVDAYTKSESDELLLQKANTVDVYQKAETYTKSEVTGLITPKANKADVDTALSNLSTTANKYYSTLADANADIANIALNQSVTIGEAQHGGIWYKATVGATSLTKSPYDPLTQSKDYTNIKTQDLIKGIPSKNLFNINAPDVAIGYFPNPASNGALQANAAYNTTGFISVIDGLQYSVSSKHYQCWFNSSKVFISGTTSADTNKTQTAPANAAYMRASCPIASWSLFQFEQSSTPTAFEKFGNLVDPTTIQSKEISVDKVKFIELGKNLFNKDIASIGVIIGADGVQGSNANYLASDFIPVDSNTQYYGTDGNIGFRFVCFYDAAKVVVAGGINDSNNTTKTFTTLSNVSFVRITFLKSGIDLFQLEKGSAATSYLSFGYIFKDPNSAPLLASVPDKTISTNKLIDSSVIPTKTNFLQKSKNLFNKATTSIGYFADPVSGNLIANASYAASVMIPVSPSVQYWGQGINGMRFVAFYNTSGNVIAGGINDSNKPKTFTAPELAAFARISIDLTDIDAFQLELGAAKTSYESFGYILKLSDGTPISLPVQSTVSLTGWNGKSWASLGDSITAMSTWQSYVTSRLGLINTNFGIGGTKISGSVGDVNAMCQDTRINAIPSTVDLVTLMGGTNDWAQNVPLGAIDSTDPTTFNGALNVFAQKAFTRWPTKRIAVATTPYGEIPDYTGRAGWTSPAHNSLGLTTNDYAEAIRQFCKRANLHCIDVAESGGWGTYNIVPYFGGSTTDNLHPASGSDAAKGIGAAHTNALNQIAPVA